MSFEENNNPYYDNDAVNRNGWQQPQYERPEPRPMQRCRRARKVWRIIGVTLLVAVLLALSVLVWYVVQRKGVSFERTEDGFRFSVGTRTPERVMQPPETAQTQPPELPPAQEQPPVSDVPQQAVQPRLELQPSQPGAETVREDAADALSLQQIYEKVIGSVVSISVRTPSGSGGGTGIIMSEDGYIITNHHVIKNAQTITVLTYDDEMLDAQVIGSDELCDLAVLKVEGSGLQAAEFGDSTVLRVGDSVVAIGDPLGVSLRGTMTDGIISAINRDLNMGERTLTLIQTNAALNDGNSGGPLINCYGQVIGINTMKMSTSTGIFSSSASVEGLGFAIPITAAKPLIDELISKGYVSGRPAVGISYEILPARFQLYYRLPAGLYVTEVLPTSDAASKGLSAGDIITAIDGTQVQSTEEFNEVLSRFSAGDTVTMTVYRGGTFYEVDIVLIDRATGK